MSALSKSDQVALRLGRRTLRDKVRETEAGKHAATIDRLLYSPSVLQTEDGQRALRTIFHYLEGIAFEEVERGS